MKTQKIADKMMHLLFQEHDRCPDPLKCRLKNEVLKELYSKHDESRVADAWRILMKQKYLYALNRDDGQILQPSDIAISDRKKSEERNASNIRSLAIWGVGIVLVALGLLMSFLKDF
jgi:hypothetical protein